MAKHEFDFELADTLAQAERDAAIARAVSAVTGTGSAICIDCGARIEAARRAAAPWAVRCIHCQLQFEREGAHAV